MIEEKFFKKQNLYSETYVSIFIEAVRAPNCFTPAIGIPDLTIAHHFHWIARDTPGGPTLVRENYL